MCTVTVIPLGPADAPWSTRRMACNRDESRRRAPALPPVRRTFADREALFPVDPASDGTWAAVNDAGLMLTLLNYNPQNVDNTYAADAARRSRGTIIPAVLAANNVAGVRATVSELVAADFAMFRLVAVDDESCLVARGDSETINIETMPLGGESLLFASSGLGDHLVERPRRELFEQTVARPPFAAATQDNYHAHSWRDRQHVSVCMRRELAMTVSKTVIEVSPRDISLTYHAGSPDEAAEVATHQLPRAASLCR